jgi:hypothetical protein
MNLFLDGAFGRVLKMTMVYAHLSPDFLSSEMNRVKF